MSTEQAQQLLEVKNLTITYKTDRGFVAAVKDVSFSVPKGGSIGLVGESGSGKSTVAMAIMRLLPANAKVTGQILFNGTDLTTIDDRQLNRKWRWRQLSMVFQKSLSALSPVHRIGDQMHDVLHQHEPSLSESQRKQKIDAVLEAVNLPQRVIRSYPFELSGGMMQRAMIALGLVCNPPFVIFDEATTALDVITQAQILSEIKRLKQEFDLTTMVISHDVGVINATTDVVAVMYGGELMEIAPRETFFKAPQHPYSRALIDSVPTLTGPKRRITGISGWRTDFGSMTDGSQLSSIRPSANGQVATNSSSLVEIAPGHFVRGGFNTPSLEVIS